MVTEFFDVHAHWRHYANDTNTYSVESKRKHWDKIKKTSTFDNMKIADNRHIGTEISNKKKAPPKEISEYPIPANNKNNFYDISQISEQQLIELLTI